MMGPMAFIFPFQFTSSHDLLPFPSWKGPFNSFTRQSSHQLMYVDHKTWGASQVLVQVKFSWGYPCQVLKSSGLDRCSCGLYTTNTVSML